jgi:hypothetical protein
MKLKEMQVTCTCGKAKFKLHKAKECKCPKCNKIYSPLNLFELLTTKDKEFLNKKLITGATIYDVNISLSSTRGTPLKIAKKGYSFSRKDTKTFRMTMTNTTDPFMEKEEAVTLAVIRNTIDSILKKLMTNFDEIVEPKPIRNKIISELYKTIYSTYPAMWWDFKYKFQVKHTTFECIISIYTD